MARIVYIYVLIDPRNNKVKYVGKTVNLQNRFEQHIYWFTGSNPRKENWIKKLIKEGLRPEMLVIEQCDYSNWQEREKFWISFYRQKSTDLTNISDGGEDSWNSLSNRNKRVLEFAKRKGIKKICKCYICGGLTVSDIEICNHCLRNHFPDYENAEWYQFLSEDYRKTRGRERHRLKRVEPLVE